MLNDKLEIIITNTFMNGSIQYTDTKTLYHPKEMRFEIIDNTIVVYAFYEVNNCGLNNDDNKYDKGEYDRDCAEIRFVITLYYIEVEDKVGFVIGNNIQIVENTVTFILLGVDEGDYWTPPCSDELDYQEREINPMEINECFDDFTSDSEIDDYVDVDFFSMLKDIFYCLVESYAECVNEVSVFGDSLDGQAIYENRQAYNRYLSNRMADSSIISEKIFGKNLYNKI